MIARPARRRSLRDARDIVVTDWVRKRRKKGVGSVISVENGFAWVDWLDGTKERVDIALLHVVPRGGNELDSRK